MTRSSIMIGAEHIHRISSQIIFSKNRPEIVIYSAQLFQRVFLYHKMEELEHKAVCYDLYKKLHGGYIRRMIGMVFITYYIQENIRRRHRYFFRKDHWWHRKRKEFRWFYFGSRGMIRVLIQKILEYIHLWFIHGGTMSGESLKSGSGNFDENWEYNGFNIRENNPFLPKRKEQICGKKTKKSSSQ